MLRKICYLCLNCPLDQRTCPFRSTPTIEEHLPNETVKLNMDHLQLFKVLSLRSNYFFYNNIQKFVDNLDLSNVKLQKVSFYQEKKREALLDADIF